MYSIQTCCLQLLIPVGGVIQALFQGWAVQASPQWAKDHFKQFGMQSSHSGGQEQLMMWTQALTCGLGSVPENYSKHLQFTNTDRAKMTLMGSEQANFKLHARCRVKVLIWEITLLQHSVSCDFC